MAMLGPRLLIRVSRQSKICDVGLNQIADDKEVRDFSLETLTRRLEDTLAGD